MGLRYPITCGTNAPVRAGNEVNIVRQLNTYYLALLDAPNPKP